jgi:seryl-tRNA synthetase
MCLSGEELTAAHKCYRDELVAAGLLIPLGTMGLYGRSGAFETVIEQFDRSITRALEDVKAEVMHFPPLLSRRHYLATNHVESFPQLMGSVHTFLGGERDHVALLRKKDEGADWSRDLAPADVMLCPAACYPLYPTATGTLPPGGRTVDLRSFVFRNEPSLDPARMLAFRQRELVRLGTPEQAFAHRDALLRRFAQLLRALELRVETVFANDPFFGRGGRMMAATQKEQDLKYELVVPISSVEKPSAVVSGNCHLDHFALAFGIRSADGQVAHTACVGCGVERVALALFRAHGFDPEKWPAGVQQVLDL